MHKFRSFYHRYLFAHQQPGTRIVHFASTAMAISSFPAAWATGVWWLPALAIVGTYLLNFASHWIFEHNAPMSLQGPAEFVMSIFADLKMFRDLAIGKERFW